MVPAADRTADKSSFKARRTVFKHPALRLRKPSLHNLLLGGHIRNSAKQTLPIGHLLAPGHSSLPTLTACHALSLGAQVITVGCEPNGLNINADCGSTHPQALQAAVLVNKADLGVAFDGDGDRIVMVDHTGSVVDGDEIIYMIARSRIDDGQPLQGVVGTLMSNMGMEVALRGLGLEFVRAKVGDRYVMEQLTKRGWTLGGEGSGHVVCLDKTTTGDAIIASLQVLTAIVRSGLSLHELRQGMSKYPQQLINVRIGQKTDPMLNPLVADAVAQSESELGDRGRVLLRASGTEPVIRVMVEGEHQTQISRLCQHLADVVRTALA